MFVRMPDSALNVQNDKWMGKKKGFNLSAHTVRHFTFENIILFERKVNEGNN